ncbi:MAG: MFS transporter [Microbacterium sp.]|uniref:MFS transporter n=1 Tax=Microbacterium sp. TaxID=51671 RepID=UPI001D5675C4|nr:MFS transporter [Microbacterium sp.]MBW8762312.1 MFS transporter [Microbacterium sp.]
MNTATTAPADPTAASRSVKVKGRWRNLSTLVGVTVVESGEGSLTTTLFPAIAKTLGLGNTELGLLSTLGRLIGVPFGPFWVWYANRTTRRQAIFVSTLLSGALAAASGFADNFVLLLLLQTLQAGAVIGLTPITNAVIADSFDDKSRGRAVGMLYGISAVLSSVIGPLIGLLSLWESGWRWGFWGVGALLVLTGFLVLVFFKETEVGASDYGAEAAKIEYARPRLKDSIALMKIPTFSVMMGSRLLSGHLLIAVFGVQFLVTERGFDVATAAIVALPFGIGYFLGTVGGGFVVSALDRRGGPNARVVFLQTAQVLFAVVAFFATQFDVGSIAFYAAFWGLMGLTQGLNPGVNRPILMSVMSPELRAQGFVIYLTIFEVVGWAAFTFVAGVLADAFGLQAVFLWVLVLLMLVNAAFLSLLYRCYPRDRQRVDDLIESRLAAEAK